MPPCHVVTTFGILYLFSIVAVVVVTAVVVNCMHSIQDIENKRDKEIIQSDPIKQLGTEPKE